MSQNCPLCQCKNNNIWLDFQEKSFGEIRLWTYYLCDECGAVYLSEDQTLDSYTENLRYNSHEVRWENNYENYLTGIWNSFKPHLSKKNKYRVLDFGCGQIQGLQKLLVDKDEFQVNSFDKYYHKDKSVLKHHYDLIFASEVLEHFIYPDREWELLNRSLNSQGQFLISTQEPPMDLSIFQKWYYRKDPTHVFFYTPKTWQWICDRYQLKMTFFENPLVLLNKG